MVTYALVALLCMIPVCAAHAFSIDDIIRHAEQKSWHAGKNLQAGDFFTYEICDGTAVARTDCYTIRMDFYALMETDNRDLDGSGRDP